MKLVLLHGSARVASRKKLLDLKQKFDPNNVVVFEEGSSVKDIVDNLVSTSLFSDDRLVILENPPEDFTNYTLYPIPYTLILWFDHEVDTKKYPSAQVLFFPESKEVSVFPFLDLLAAGNIKAFLEIQKLKDAGYDIFYFNTMVIYLLRNLVNTPKNVPGFVADKLQRQRARFNQNKITSLYNATRYKTRSDVIASYYKDILELDFKLKSGLIESQQAEFFLVNRFMD